MGYLKEKYTKEYFTSLDADNNYVGYGAIASYDQKDGNLVLRQHDLTIINQLVLKGKRILDIGSGRGEILRYCLEKEVEYCVGIDFSDAAIAIAAELLKPYPRSNYQLILDDALTALKKLHSSSSPKFDIITVFDSIEHIPRFEMRKILPLLKGLLSHDGVLVINTPCYKFDNDVVENGYDERNWIDCSDTSDQHEKTKGMHCNKYTTPSLLSFFSDFGFVNLTSAHFFAHEDKFDADIKRISFQRRWEIAKSQSLPLCSNYLDDKIEFPYSTIPVEWFEFSEGYLKGIKLLLEEQVKDLVFEDGEYDRAFFENLSQKGLGGCCVLDVGCFIGTDSLIFSKLIGEKGRVLAFEPNPWNRDRIFRNLSGNKHLAKRIEVFPYALGQKNTVAKMTLSASIDNGHSSTSRLSECRTSLGRADLPESFYDEDVEVITLDSFIEQYNIVPDIIKVDIEGAESLFLQGAINTLTSYSPVLFIELHTQLVSVQCTRQLLKMGYIITILSEESDGRVFIKAERAKVHTNIAPLRNNEEKLNQLEENLALSQNNYLIEFRQNLLLKKQQKSLTDKCNNLEEQHQALLNSKAVRLSNKIKKIIGKPVSK